MIPYDDSQVARLETLEEEATSAVINHENGAITLQDAEATVAQLRNVFEETESPGIALETRENAAYIRNLERLSYLEERLTRSTSADRFSKLNDSEAATLAMRGLARYIRVNRESYAKSVAGFHPATLAFLSVIFQQTKTPGFHQAFFIYQAILFC
jgi:hypothetical protein